MLLAWCVGSGASESQLSSAANVTHRKVVAAAVNANAADSILHCRILFLFCFFKASAVLKKKLYSCCKCSRQHSVVANQWFVASVSNTDIVAKYNQSF